jgi:hypothetical protein
MAQSRHSNRKQEMFSVPDRKQLYVFGTRKIAQERNIENRM